MSDNHAPMGAKRIRTWYRRLVALLLGSVSLIVVLAIMGYSTGWVGVIASFTFAECTRRIMAEQYPDRAMSWCQIFRYAWLMDRAAKQDDKPDGDDRP